jgi:hypothetical protein
MRSRWKLVGGALLILAAVGNSTRDVPDGAAGALGALTGICLLLFGGIALVRSGLRTGEGRIEAATTLSSTARERPYTVASVGGVVIVGIGALGIIASLVAGSVANLLNMALFTAFGLAVLARHASAVVLGWSYLALLVFMTVMHGFIPLEIAQCALVLALVVYVRGRV